MDEHSLRRQICNASQALWARGLIVGDCGLISTELHRRRYLVTPPGLRRCHLDESSLQIVDLGGSDINGTSELDLACWQPHRIAYKAHEFGADHGSTTRATVTSTPPMTEALRRVTGASDQMALPGLPPLPIVDAEDESGIVDAMRTTNAIMLKGMGLFCCGSDLSSTLNTLEHIEHAATIELACLNHRS